MKYTLAAISLLASANALTTVASTSTVSVPAPGASCTGFAYCAGENTPIILRCTNGIIQPGNCDDNLNEPPLGALCVSYAPAQASCSAVQGFSSTGTAPIVTGTGSGSSPSSNGTLSYTPTGPTASKTGTSPVSTGGANGKWTGSAMVGAVMAVIGGIVAL